MGALLAIRGYLEGAVAVALIVLAGMLWATRVDLRAEKAHSLELQAAVTAAQSAAKECSDKVDGLKKAGEEAQKTADKSRESLERSVSALAVAAGQRVQQAQQQAPPSNAPCEEVIRWLDTSVSAQLASAHWPSASPAR